MATEVYKSTSPHVLLAECDHELRALLKHILQRAAYTVKECPSGSALRRLLLILVPSGEIEDFDLLLLDQRMLDPSAVQLIRGLQQRQRYPPLVLVNGWNSPCGDRVHMLRVAAVLDAPTNAPKCVARLREIAPHRHLPTTDT